MADVEKRKSLLVRLVEGMGSSGMGAAGLGTGFGVPPSPEAGSSGPGASDELRGVIRSTIEEIAASGDAVIVAHAASLALGEREDVLRAAITASQGTRERRLASELGVSEKEIARTLKRSDAGRADYIKRFYGISEELPTHYDLVVNTDKLSAEDAAELIVQAAAPSRAPLA